MEKSIAVPESFFLRELASHVGELDANNSRPTGSPRAYLKETFAPWAAKMAHLTQINKCDPH